MFFVRISLDRYLDHLNIFLAIGFFIGKFTGGLIQWQRKVNDNGRFWISNLQCFVFIDPMKVIGPPPMFINYSRNRARGLPETKFVSKASKRHLIT